MNKAMSYLITIFLLISSLSLDACSQRMVLTKEGYPSIIILGYVPNQIFNAADQETLDSDLRTIPDTKHILIDSNITADMTMAGAPGSFLIEAEIYHEQHGLMTITKAIKNALKKAGKTYQAAHPLALLTHIASGVPTDARMMPFFNSICPSSTCLTPDNFRQELEKTKAKIRAFSSEISSESDICKNAHAAVEKSLNILNGENGQPVLELSNQSDVDIFTDEVSEVARKQYIENGCKKASEISNIPLLTYRLFTLAHHVQRSQVQQQTPHSIIALYAERNAIPVTLAFCLGTGYKIATNTRPTGRFLQLETIRKSFNE